MNGFYFSVLQYSISMPSSTTGLQDATGLAQVEALMLRLAVGNRLEPAGRIAQETLLTGGKRVRARLALAASAALGVQGEDEALDIYQCRMAGVPWAAACELLHNATLLHDDIQDGDRIRRDHPTAWAQHGIAQAINAGDLMLMLPFLAINQLDASPAIKGRLMTLLAEAATWTARGQATELALLENGQLTFADWAWAAEGKSGVLLGLPVAGAALLANLELRTAEDLGRAFQEIGVLYQLQDDLLDLSFEKGHGQRAGDVREGKVTALIVAHLQLHPEDREDLLDFLKTPSRRNSPTEVQLWVQRLVTGGAVALVQIWARQVAGRVLNSPRLQAIPALFEVAEELVNLIMRRINQ